MGRVLSTIIAVALLLGLGALAVLALPGTGAPMTASPVAAAPLAAEPDAPAAAQISLTSLRCLCRPRTPNLPQWDSMQQV